MDVDRTLDRDIWDFPERSDVDRGHLRYRLSSQYGIFDFIAILLLCIFSLALRVSMLEDKCTTLAGEIAIRTHQEEDEEK